MDTKHSRLEYLRCAKLGLKCDRCALAKAGRTQVVFGDGNPEANLMVIGSGPGRFEDILGETITGRPSMVFNKMLKQAGTERGNVYVAHVVKCRPPNDRVAQATEVQKCAPYLHAQIGIVRPSAILTLGELAGNVVTGQRPHLSMPVLASRSWSYAFEQTQMHVPVFCIENPSDIWDRIQPQQGRVASDAKHDYRKAVAMMKKAVAMSQPLDIEGL